MKFKELNFGNSFRALFARAAHVEMVQVYYFDVDCSLAGEMGRAVFSEGDPRIIEFH